MEKGTETDRKNMGRKLLELSTVIINKSSITKKTDKKKEGRG